MKYKKEILSGDLPDKFLDETKNAFMDFAAAMFLYDRGINSKSDPKDGVISPNASGTLVSCGNRFGILTAHHVVFPSISAAQRDGKILGIVVPKSGDHVSIPANLLNVFPIGRTTETIKEGPDFKNGPDLCFLEIPPGEELSTLKAKKSFWSIDRTTESFGFDFDSVTPTFCSVGAPQCYVNTSVISTGYQFYTRIIGFFGGRGNSPVEFRDGFDYIDLPFEYTENNELPENFQGLSGGGLWRFQIESSDDGNTLRVANRALCGVAFYQSPRGEDKVRMIRHHFCESIYSMARSVLNGKA